MQPADAVVQEHADAVERSQSTVYPQAVWEPNNSPAPSPLTLQTFIFSTFFLLSVNGSSLSQHTYRQKPHKKGRAPNCKIRSVLISFKWFRHSWLALALISRCGRRWEMELRIKPNLTPCGETISEKQALVASEPYAQPGRRPGRFGTDCRADPKNKHGVVECVWWGNKSKGLRRSN